MARPSILGTSERQVSRSNGVRHDSSHAFRKLGISLFFAALGLVAGDQFLAEVLSPRGLAWLTGGLVITLVPLAAVGLWPRAEGRAALLMHMDGTQTTGLANHNISDPAIT
jgi:uncharacterized transporter YbjL